jgi:hypothetical protein
MVSVIADFISCVAGTTHTIPCRIYSLVFLVCDEGQGPSRAHFFAKCQASDGISFFPSLT